MENAAPSQSLHEHDIVRTIKIWIFNPSEKWTYCSGVAIALAADFDKAVKLLKHEDGDQSFYRTQSDVPNEAYSHQWVLEASYDLKETPAEKAWLDYNWA